MSILFSLGSTCDLKETQKLPKILTFPLTSMENRVWYMPLKENTWGKRRFPLEVFIWLLMQGSLELVVIIRLE